MNNQELLVRKSYCYKKRLCFISLKPLKKDARLKKIDVVDMVFVNPEYMEKENELQSRSK